MAFVIEIFTMASWFDKKVEVIKSSGRFYSPLVKSIAKKENISNEQLDSIEGSGKNGRVSKKDVLNYLDQKLVIL